jgi:hypothetical protein
MAGFVPAIHVSLLRAQQGVDARDKRGHDRLRCAGAMPHGIGISCTFFGTW